MRRLCPLPLAWMIWCSLLLLINLPAETLPPLVQTSPLPLSSTAAAFIREGRFDDRQPEGPVIIWQGSRLGAECVGTRLTLRFGPATGQNFFNVTVDGVTEIVGVPAGEGSTWDWPHPLREGWHRLELFKRTEADAGSVRFDGLILAPGATVRRPPPAATRLRMEFYGDSIMAGACNEDGATDQWEDRRTHNHALSYTTLTAAAFSADDRCIAVSGMGIAAGWVEPRAGQTWDKLYPRPDAPRADLAAWQPDVVLVNFGENDDSFTRANGQPFPQEYTKGYVALVRAIRSAYPRAQLVLLRGGMSGGAKSPELRAAWEAAVNELESGDTHIAHYVFLHWSELHPRVSDDRAMAAELTDWLKQQPWMAPYL